MIAAGIVEVKNRFILFEAGKGELVTIRCYGVDQGVKESPPDDASDSFDHYIS